MKINDLYKDPIADEEEFLPASNSVSINSGKSKMYGVLYTAAGKGPHPTMLLLHGFPGTEKNLDLAHAFRRVGWNTLVFHYRGAWGSEGNFSFENVLDDVKAALKFVRTDDVSKEYRIDTQKIVLLGHSMGGFAALLSTIDDINIKACIALAPFDFGLIGKKAKEFPDVLATLKDVIKDCIEPLKGTTVETLTDEILKNAEVWDFINNAEKLSSRKLLLVAGERDTVAVPEYHYYPLVDFLTSLNAVHFEYHLLNSDHSFQDKRIVLSEIIQRWLEKEV